MKFFVVLFAFIAAASAGLLAPYPDAAVLSVHESASPLITTLHHTGAVVAPAAAITYAAPAVYAAPSYGYAHGYGIPIWRKKRAEQ
ncbi:unnamed protein product [Hermetia illucens]|uniref:Uncharacterized protein n=1 Tax=Hermetia illucens TaxID=343691 RepID=A0A7R8UHX2_HERIL|nr:cuticle protein 38-like [Hermetia illucens]CAD7080874.1 unnamed protein product [Hermetia illucens]